MDPEWIYKHIPARILDGWGEYYLLEPWGGLTDYWRAGLVTAAIYNTVRDAKKKPEPFTANDFIPDSLYEKPKKSPEDLYKEFKAYFLAAGATAPGSEPIIDGK